MSWPPAGRGATGQLEPARGRGAFGAAGGGLSHWRGGGGSGLEADDETAGGERLNELRQWEVAEDEDDDGGTAKYGLKGQRLRMFGIAIALAFGLFLLAIQAEQSEKRYIAQGARARNPSPSLHEVIRSFSAGPARAGPVAERPSADEALRDVIPKHFEGLAANRPPSDATASEAASAEQVTAADLGLPNGGAAVLPNSGAGDAYPEGGFVRRPRIPAGPRNGDDGKLHIIFSSGCNYFQHWQSELLLATAKMVNQRGRITRIVSGCHDKSAEMVQHRHQTFPSGPGDLLVPLSKLNRSLNDDFGLYITPSFPGARDFPWINKPNSIRYFMENARDELDREGETVIAILDPDFIFLKPLTQSGLDPTEIIATRRQDLDPAANSPLDHVKLGRPVAQRYGLEGAWVAKFDVAEITGDPKSPAATWTESQARRYTSVGPPLMLHVDDLTTLSRYWSEYMPRVLRRDHDILADMWAYSIAAAHLGLLHTTLDQYMISNHGVTGQAYSFVNQWPKEMSCRNPRAPPGAKVPVFIHMASNFKAPDKLYGPWMFHKGHVPPDILDCHSPLLIEAPDDLRMQALDWKAEQHAWILCNIVSRLNQVALEYKTKFCPDGFESRKLVRLIQRKTRDRGCSKSRDLWCYPLAQIEGLPENWREIIAASRSF